MYDIWHNILWSKYKGVVFSELNKIAKREGATVNFFQIASTESERIGLAPIDRSVHDYPYTLLFEQAYESIPRYKLFARTLALTLSTKAQFVLLAGYHAPEYWIQLACLILKGTRRGVFCDATAYDRPQTVFRKVLKVIFFSFCHKIFCYGQRSKEYAMQHGVPENRIVIRCQAAALAPSYDPDVTLLERAKRVSTAPLLLYVGRLAPEKNLDRLIDAFVRIRGSYSDATLRIVGSGRSKQQLIDHCDRSGVDGIEWIGGLSGEALVSEYLAATALILPSLSEPWGLVVNEALSYGCPVIVSNRCGCAPELVQESVTGYLVDPFDVADIVNKIHLAFHDLRDIAVSKKCIEAIGQFKSSDAARQIFDGLCSL